MTRTQARDRIVNTVAICDECLLKFTPRRRKPHEDYRGVHSHIECSDAAYQLSNQMAGVKTLRMMGERLHALHSLSNLRWLLEHHPQVAARLNAEARVMRMILLNIKNDKRFVTGPYVNEG